MGVLPDWMIERDVTITPFAPAEKREGKISFGVSSYGYDASLGYKFRVFRVPTSSPAGVIDPKAFDPRMLENVDLTPNQACPGCNGTGTDIRIEMGPKFPNAGRQCVTCRGEKVIQVPDHILIPPHSFVLAESLETFKIPRDVLCVVLGKSTYARCGLIVNVTPLEPEWEGVVTIELSNTTPLPMKVYPGEGIMQCLFFRSDGWREWIWRKLSQTWTNVFKAAKRVVFDDLTPKEIGQTSCRQSYGDKAGKYQNQGGLTLPTVDKAVTSFPFCVCKCGNTVKVTADGRFGHHQSKPATYCLNSGLVIDPEYLKEQGVSAAKTNVPTTNKPNPLSNAEMVRHGLQLPNSECHPNIDGGD